MNEGTTRPRGTSTTGRRASPGLETASGLAPKRDRLAEMEGRIAELERDNGLRARGRGLMNRVMPAEASQHFRNAGREQLLGIRSIVDFWIRRIDASEGRGEEPRESIEIE